MEKQIFKGVLFWLPSCVPLSDTENLRHALIVHGGVETDSLTDATHVVTNSDRFSGWKSVQESQAIVTVCSRPQILYLLSTRLFSRYGWNAQSSSINYKGMSVPSCSPKQDSQQLDPHTILPILSRFSLGSLPVQLTM